MDRRTFITSLGTFLISPKIIANEEVQDVEIVKPVSEMLAAIATTNTVIATGGVLSLTSIDHVFWAFHPITQQSDGRWVGLNKGDKVFIYSTQMGKQLNNLFKNFNVETDAEEFDLELNQSWVQKETTYDDDTASWSKHRDLHLKHDCTISFILNEEVPADTLIILNKEDGTYGKVQVVQDPY